MLLKTTNSTYSHHNNLLIVPEAHTETKAAMEDKWMPHIGISPIMVLLLTLNIHILEETKNVLTNQKWKPSETETVHKFQQIRLLL